MYTGAISFSDWLRYKARLVEEELTILMMCVSCGCVENDVIDSSRKSGENRNSELILDKNTLSLGH